MPKPDDEKRIDVAKAPSTLGVVDKFLGSVIDNRFKIKSRIARGGMATVYKAEDRRLDRLVAVKIMHPHLADSADFVTRFRREARSAARLTHPGIVAIHDQGVVDGSGYLVMELIEGPNLRTLLKREGCFTLKRSLNIISEILQALYAAHEHDIVHRDMKPENVLITPYGKVKVADFGLAKAVSETTAANTSTVLGTVSYMAPEIITTGSADLRADIYATGIMLYELLAGEPPLSGSAPIQIAYKHVHEDIPSIREELYWVPETIDELIGKLTARNVEDRPQDAKQAYELVQKALSEIHCEILDKKADVEPKITEELEEEIVEYDSGTTSALTYNNGTMALSMDGTNYRPVGMEKDEYNNEENIHKQSIVSKNQSSSSTDIAMPLMGQVVSTKDHKEKKKLKRLNGLTSKIKPLWMAIIAIILLVAVGLWWFILGPGAYTKIPNVIGKTHDEAVKILKKDNISFNVKYVFSDTVEKDRIVGTDPKDKVYKNEKINLLISKGVEQISIPKVAGMTKEEATKALLDANLQLKKDTVEIWSEEVEKGKVAGTDPGAETVIPHTQFVTIQISKGREPISVPNIVGKTSTEAKQILENAGLKPAPVEDFSDKVEKGKVISQNPNGDGTTLFRNEPVKYVVSKGPRTIPIPNVFGKSVGEATSILENAGFKVKIVKILGGAFGIVRSTTPNAGEQATLGSVITVTVL